MTSLIVILLTFLLGLSGFGMYVGGQKWKETQDQVWVLLVFASMAGLLFAGYYLNLVLSS